MKNLLTPSLLVMLAAGISVWAVSFARPQESPRRDPADEAVPAIALSVNNLDEATVKTGAPLWIEAVVGPADGRDSDTSLRLEGGTGGWGSLLRVDIKDARGNAVPGIVAKPAFATDASIELNSETLGQMVWTVEFETGHELAPGDYTLVATLDSTTSSGGGWHGKTSSTSAKLTIKAATATLSLAEARLSALAEIAVKSSQKKHDQAQAVADGFLASHANDELILEAQGDALVRQGKIEEALAAYNSVLAQSKPGEESPLREPPVNVLRKIELATQALRKK